MKTIIIYLTFFLILSGCNNIEFKTNPVNGPLTIESLDLDGYIPVTSLSNYSIAGNCPKDVPTLQIVLGAQTLSAACTNKRYSQNFDLSAVSDGAVTLTVSAADTIQNKYLIIDRIPPAGSLSISGIGSTPTDDASIRVLGVTGAADVYAYKAKLTSLSSCSSISFDGISERIVSQDFGIDLYANAVNRVCVIGRDKAGNWQTTASSSSQVHLDTDVPSKIFELNHPSFFNSTILTPVMSWEGVDDNDGGSGIANYQIAIGTTPGSSDIQTWTNVGNVESIQLAVNLLSYSGTKVYPQIRALDNVGKVSLTTSSNGWYVGNPTVNVAFTRPTLSSTIRLSNRLSYLVEGVCSEVSRNVTINITGRAADVLTCDVNGQFSKSYDLSSTPDGSVTFTATHDNVSAITATDTVTITKDTIAPTVSITSPSNGSTYTGSQVSAFPISGTCSVPGRNVIIETNFGYSTTVSCSSGNAWNITPNLSAVNDSAIVFSVQMSDAAGNISNPVSRTFVNGSVTPVNEPLTAIGSGNTTKVMKLGNSGKMVALSAYYDNSIYSVISVNQDGSELNPVTALSTVKYSAFSDTHAPYIYNQPRDEIFFRGLSPAKESENYLFSSKVDGTGYRKVLGAGANPNVSYNYAEINSDGTKIIVIADREVDEQYDLYVANSLDGSGIIKLNSALPTGADVRSFAYIPTLQKVIYLADQDTLSLPELYIVNLDGTGRSKINPPFLTVNLAIETRGVMVYRFNSTYTRIVFIGDFASNTQTEIYSYDLVNGGAPVQVHGAALSASNREQDDMFVISPDGQKVAYMSDSGSGTGTGNGWYHAYVGNIDGSGSIRITPDLTSIIDAAPTFSFSHDGSKLLFFMDQTADGIFNAYVADATKAFDAPGGNALTLISAPSHDAMWFNQTQPVKPNQRTEFLKYQFSSDDTYVIATMSDQSHTTDKEELWRYRVDGTEQIRLSPFAVDKGRIVNAEISPTNGRIILWGDLDVDERWEIYSVNFDGSDWKKISEPILITQGDVQYNIDQRFIDWQTGRVIYTTDRSIDSIFELRSVTINGAAPTLLSNGDTSFSDAGGSMAWTPDGESLIYRANPSQSSQYKLFAIDKNATSERVLFNPPDANGTVLSVRVSSDSSKVAFSYLPGEGLVPEIWVANIIGPPSPTKVSGIHSNPFGNIAGYSISPDSQWIAYRIDADIDEAYDIYVVRTNGTGLRKVNSTLASSSEKTYTTFTFSPDSTKLAYTQNYVVNAAYDLLVTDVATPGSNTIISNFGTYASGGALTQWFGFSYDSSKIIFSGDFDANSQYSIYSSNLDGTGRIKISRSISTSAQSISGFLISPNSHRIVYAAEDETPGVRSLTAVNLDGTNLVTLTPSMASNTTYAINGEILPTGELITIMDHDLPTKQEIYSIKIDGSGLIKLNPSIHADSDVSSLKISPDKLKISYLADQDLLGKKDLYVVNPNGTGNINLSQVPSNADVQNYERNNNGVVYRSDEFAEGVTDLYYVNFDGTGKKKISNNSPQGFYGVDTMSISPVSNRTFYTADLYHFMTFDMFFSNP